MAKCFDCAKLALHPYPRHAKLGWGRCTVAPAATFHDFQRERRCQQHQLLDAEKLAKRIAWKEKGEPEQ